MRRCNAHPLLQIRFDRFGRQAFSALLAFAAMPTMAGTWSLAATPGMVRTNASAFLLDDGRVLVSGGYANLFNCEASAELYDPATDTWASTGPMATSRCGSPSVKLGSGKVLTVGAYPGVPATAPAAELYSPATGTWSATGNQPPQREAPAAALATATMVLMTGGYASGTTIPAWLYDAALDQWIQPSQPLRNRYNHTATSMDGGAVLLVGGDERVPSPVFQKTHDSSEWYSGGTFSDATPLNQARFDHLAIRLQSGALLVLGGRKWVCNSSGSCGSQPVVSAEIRSSGGGGWQLAASPSLTYKNGAKSVLLTDGRLLFVGGHAVDGSYDDTEIYDPATNTWTAGPSLTHQRLSPTATLLADGRVLVSGGVNRVPAEIFTP